MLRINLRSTRQPHVFVAPFGERKTRGVKLWPLRRQISECALGPNDTCLDASFSTRPLVHESRPQASKLVISLCRVSFVWPSYPTALNVEG